MRSTNAGDEPEDPYKDFLDQERDSREARSRLGSVDPTVNLAADNFDRPLDSSAAATVSLLECTEQQGCVMLLVQL
jgi:hypothetical protein